MTALADEMLRFGRTGWSKVRLSRVPDLSDTDDDDDEGTLAPSGRSIFKRGKPPSKCQAFAFFDSLQNARKTIRRKKRGQKQKKNKNKDKNKISRKSFKNSNAKPIASSGAVCKNKWCSISKKKTVVGSKGVNMLCNISHIRLFQTTNTFAP